VVSIRHRSAYCLSARLGRRPEAPVRNRTAAPILSLADADCGRAMNRKTLHEFAELHAPTAMHRWRQAHADCQLRALNGDEGEADPTSPADPGNIVAEAEAEIEAILAEVLKKGRYSIEGRRNGAVERLQSYTMNRLRLALDTGGVSEIDHEGRTANAWSDCDVIDDGMDKAVTQPVPPSGSQAPDQRAHTLRRKSGVSEKNDSELIDKVRRDMTDDQSLALYAAVQRHCREKTKNAIDAAYKRVSRKIKRP
jgi:hypothetical protein